MPPSWRERKCGTCLLELDSDDAKPIWVRSPGGVHTVRVKKTFGRGDIVCSEQHDDLILPMTISCAYCSITSPVFGLEKNTYVGG